MTHSKGPWNIWSGATGHIVDSYDRVIALAMIDFVHDEAEVKSNALLIAAAPELLEACERTLKWLEAMDVQELIVVDMAIVNLLREAIDNTK